MPGSIDWGDTAAAGSHLLLFAGGSPRYASAGRRSRKEAIGSGLFSNVVCLQGHHLPELAPDRFQGPTDSDIWRTRGGGYWWWKAALLHAYVQLPELGADRIFYMDVGCHLNLSPGARTRFHDYERAVDTDGALLFHLQGRTDRAWTRPDVAQYLSMTDAELDTPQVTSGFFGFANDARTRQVARRWNALCAFGGGALLEDQEGTVGHVGHRHDQSLFSVVIKQMGYRTRADETYTELAWSQGGRDWPVWAVRNRGGATFSTHRLWFRIKDRCNRIACRLRPGPR